MKFYKITQTQPVMNYLLSRLTEALGTGRSVLWLIPGGSAIGIAADVSQALRRASAENRQKSFDLSKLTVSLTDERYGPVGHPDSNWRQLEAAGFTLPGANLQPVLNGKSRAETAQDFHTFLQIQLSEAHYKLGFFGIGPDGHTAGILPGSPAVGSIELAQDYDAGNYERITMTPNAIGRLDEAVVYATGQAKWPVIDQLEGVLPLAEQPAQSLKQVPKLTVFNDYKGDEL